MSSEEENNVYNSSERFCELAKYIENVDAAKNNARLDSQKELILKLNYIDDYFEYCNDELEEILNNPRKCIELIQDGKIASVIKDFPDHSEMIRRVRDRFHQTIQECESAYDIMKNFILADFGYAASQTCCSAAFFNMRDEKVQSFEEYFMKMNPRKLIRLLGF